MYLDFRCCFSLQITAVHCVYFGLFPIQSFAKIPKGMAGSLSFDVQGRGVLLNWDSFGQTEKGGRKFFMDAINAWSPNG